MSGFVMVNGEAVEARLKAIKAALEALRPLGPQGGRVGSLLDNIATEAAALRETLDAPAREARHRQALEGKRCEAADALYEAYDFPGDVEDAGGWEIAGEDWSRPVYLLAGMDEPTVPVTFRLAFEPGRTTVEAFGACEPDRPVVKASSYAVEM